jgi:hypothetical protein
MIENTFIKKITDGILRNRKMTVMERNIMHPERDWLLGIFVGMVVVTIAAVWSMGTYVQFKNISVTSSTDSPDSIIYKENLVNSALTDFGERKEMYELLKKELIGKKQVPAETVAPVEVPVVGGVEEEVVTITDALPEEPLEVVPEATDETLITQ